MAFDPNDLEGEFNTLLEQPNRPQPVGAPSEMAEAEEMPDWFANLVKGLSAMPILIGFLCGGVPVICGILWCILTILL